MNKTIKQEINKQLTKRVLYILAVILLGTLSFYLCKYLNTFPDLPFTLIEFIGQGILIIINFSLVVATILFFVISITGGCD